MSVIVKTWMISRKTGQRSIQQQGLMRYIPILRNPYYEASHLRWAACENPMFHLCGFWMLLVLHFIQPSHSSVKFVVVCISDNLRPMKPSILEQFCLKATIDEQFYTLFIEQPEKKTNLVTSNPKILINKYNYSTIQPKNPNKQVQSNSNLEILKDPFLIPFPFTIHFHFQSVNFTFLFFGISTHIFRMRRRRGLGSLLGSRHFGAGCWGVWCSKHIYIHIII